MADDQLVTELIARMEIQALIGQYCQLLDDLRIEEWAQLFCADAEWIADPLRFRGRGAIADGVRALEPAEPGKVRHLSFLPVIAFEGGQALVWTDNIALTMNDDRPQLVSSRRYHDVVRQEERRWRFLRRVSVSVGTPLASGARAAPATGILVGRSDEER